MRLIDADNLKNTFWWIEVCRLSKKEIIKIIDESPTITPEKEKIKGELTDDEILQSN